MGVGGGWEAEGGPNHPPAQKKCRRVLNKAKKQQQCSYMSGQDGRWEQPDTTCSLISAPQWHHAYTPQCTVMNLQGQINAACESRPGHPQPCHWSVWIVLECGFHVKL